MSKGEKKVEWVRNKLRRLLILLLPVLERETRPALLPRVLILLQQLVIQQLYANEVNRLLIERWMNGEVFCIGQMNVHQLIRCVHIQFHADLSVGSQRICIADRRQHAHVRERRTSGLRPKAILLQQ